MLANGTSDHQVALHSPDTTFALATDELVRFFSGARSVHPRVPQGDDKNMSGGGHVVPSSPAWSLVHLEVCVRPC